MSQELSIEKLRRVCESTQLGCATSQDFLALESIIGQERAVRSLKFGLDIKEKGFNGQDGELSIRICRWCPKLCSKGDDVPHRFGDFETNIHSQKT